VTKEVAARRCLYRRGIVPVTAGASGPPSLFCTGPGHLAIPPDRGWGGADLDRGLHGHSGIVGRLDAPWRATRMNPLKALRHD
jgi:hypothetical protein